MEHLGYLFAAYSIIFAVIFLYVMFIWRRQAALDAELRTLDAGWLHCARVRLPLALPIRELMFDWLIEQ